MLTDYERVVRGSQAEMILLDNALKAIFASMEAGLATAILGPKLAHKEAREDLYLTVHGLRLFKASLESYRTDKDSVLAMKEREITEEDAAE